ncbi:MAG: type II toxin-antitoxin system VapC family toxin [Microlunatus sp.]
MERNLILDTGTLIAFERGDLDRAAFRDDDVAVAAITIAEYRTGIELADPVRRAEDRERALAALMPVLQVLDYTPNTAAHHARLLAHVRRAGRPRGAHDLIIAAHAVEAGRLLVSTDAAARFGDLPGVEVVTT